MLCFDAQWAAYPNFLAEGDAEMQTTLRVRLLIGFALSTCLLSMNAAADHHPFNSDADRRYYDSGDNRGQDRYSRDRRERDRYYDREEQDRYEYCRDEAADESGYRGTIPAEYRRGSKALEGAFKGAASGAAASWVTGGDKEQRKRAAKRAAGLGLLIGAIKGADDEKKRRRNAEKRRRFERLLDRCMSR